MKTQWTEPNWSVALAARIKRCIVLKDLGDWKQLQDLPRGKDHIMWYHQPTQTLQLKDPFN